MSLSAVIKSANLVSEDEEIEILTIFQRCAAVKVGGYILGSADGRYKSSSIIKTKLLHDDNVSVLSKVHYFAKCSCILKKTNRTHAFWFAATSNVCRHQCKVWFGHPLEVWTRVSLPDMHFVSVSFFDSQKVDALK